MKVVVLDTTCPRHPSQAAPVVDAVRDAVLDGSLSGVTVLKGQSEASIGGQSPYRAMITSIDAGGVRQCLRTLARELRSAVGNVLVFDCACDIRPDILPAFANLASSTALVAEHVVDQGMRGAKVQREGRRFLRLRGLDGSGSYAYMGALLLAAPDGPALAEILEDPQAPPTWQDTLHLLVKRMTVRCALLTRDIHGDPVVVEEWLAGGSYAQTYVRLVSEGRRTVRKEAQGKGRAKLAEEINWLRGLETDASRHFSAVLRHRIDAHTASVDLDYHHLPTLRRLILAGAIDASEAARWARRVLSLVGRDLYPVGRRKAPKDFIRRAHLDRIADRLAETAAQLPDRHPLWTNEYVHVNGVRRRNVRSILDELACDKEILALLTPDRLVRTHGDLHFDNILIDRSNHRCLLIDPRGNAGYDVHYDLGKVWHSVNSLYDLIHGGHVQVAAHSDGIDYAFTSPHLVSVYHVVRQQVHAWLNAVGWDEDDPHWMLKVRLAEAAHMCSVMPFHIAHDKDETVVLACYARGVELINDLYADLKAAVSSCARPSTPVRLQETG
jgi:hypothetical protein